MKTLICLFALAQLTLQATARLVVYPAPADETFSTDYQVSAGGQKVDVYTARVLDPPFAGKEFDYGGPYSFANFDLKGRVEVRITSKRSLANSVVRPQVAGLKLRHKDEHTVLLTLPGPCKLSFEPDGKKGPLLLFANPLEANAPKTNAPNTLYFGPGIHKPGKILLTNNQTLYLAGGAIVKGGIQAEGNNIRITGRGILDGSDWEWRKGPTMHVIMLHGTNLEVSGITIRGPSHWTIVPRASRDVRIQDVKICGSRVQNDDGINPCNSQQVRISNCFIRTDDDCLALKGLDLQGGNVEDITVENCVLWCDRARIFLLGHESRAPFMRNVRLRNLDIIHFNGTAFLFEPGEEMRLEDVRVENVRVNGEGHRELIRLRPVVNQYMRNKVPGHVSEVHFRNVEVTGQPGIYKVQLMGADEAHAVQKVSFEGVKILGRTLDPESPGVEVGKCVSGVRFGK